jgi:hypothetical protein
LFEESFQPPDAASRLRRIAFISLATFIATQLYFTIAPLLGASPVVFYAVDAIALFGFLFGVIASIRIALRETLHRRAIITLVAGLACACLNAWVFAQMTFPWL